MKRDADVPGRSVWVVGQHPRCTALALASRRVESRRIEWVAVHDAHPAYSNKHKTNVHYCVVWYNAL